MAIADFHNCFLLGTQEDLSDPKLAGKPTTIGAQLVEGTIAIFRDTWI
jgi:hypothetical protein